MQIFTEGSIEDSYIYKTFNASNKSLEKIVKYIKTAVVLDKTYFEDKYIQLRKSNISPISNKVLDAFDKGEIEVLYSREVKVGISFPFIIRKTPEGKIVASILIGAFSDVDKNNDLTIQMKPLYGLLESAFIAYKIQTQPSNLTRNMSLLKITRDIYRDMILRILNKEYNLSMDKILFDKVSYIISRFYLERMWGYPSGENVENYSKHGLKFIDEFDLQLIQTAYDDHDIKSIDQLVSFLATVSPRMEKLDIRYFIEKYVQTYHAASIMSMDYLPYLFFVISNTILSTFLISQPILGQIIKETKSINKYYSDLYNIF